MDSATGLLYLGNGQYYDPATGRFLNRSARPNQANPYVPWSGDPLGALMAPLAVMTVVLGRKKKHGKWDNLMVVLVLVLASGFSISACDNPPPQNPNSTLPPPMLIKVTITPMGTTVSQKNTPVASSTAVKSPDEGGCTFILKPNSIDLGSDWKITHYHYAMGNDDDAFPPNDLVTVGGLGSRKFRRQFIYNINKGIPLQGTGLAEDGITYINVNSG